MTKEYIVANNRYVKDFWPDTRTIIFTDNMKEAKNYYRNPFKLLMFWYMKIVFKMNVRIIKYVEMRTNGT